MSRTNLCLALTAVLFASSSGVALVLPIMTVHDESPR